MRYTKFEMTAMAAALAGAALCSSGLAQAADAMPGSDPSMATAGAMVDKSDAEFFQKAAMSGMTEIAAAKIAMTKSSDPQIKAFAQKMVKDHGRADTKLKALAMKKGVTLPTAIDSDHQDKLDELNKAKSGKEFDDQYSDMMSSAHDDAVDLFTDTAKDSKDADVKMFATETLPTLRVHKTMADKLDDAH